MKSIVLMMSLLLPIDAWAGQLHLEWMTLGEIARYGIAVLGTVVSVNSTSQHVRVHVKKVWQREDNEFLPLDSAGVVPNETQDFPIYGGVVWTDPGESPIDRRVPGALSLVDVKAGQDVVLVSNKGYEMLPANINTLHKLELFFSAPAFERYKNSAPADDLYRDLSDPDLWKPALEAMAARQLLAPRAFLALEPYKIFELGWNLGQRLPAPEFDAWVLAMSAAIHDGPRRLRLVALARESSLSEKISLSTQLALIQSLDLSDHDQQNNLSWFVQSEARAIKASPEAGRARRAVELALTLAAARGDRAQHDELVALRDLIASLPEADQREAYKRVGALVMSSRMARESKEHFDDVLFEFFLEQVTRAPSAKYLPELAGIDLAHIPESRQWRVESRVAVLNAGLVIARADPAHAGAVYTALEKWVRDEAVFEPKLILSVDSETPEAKREHWVMTLRQFKELRGRSPIGRQNGEL